jgi:hypothetical protein
MAARKPWYKTLTAQIVGATTVVTAATSLVVAGHGFFDQFGLFSSTPLDSKYETAAKNALDKLDAFKPPAITSPQCSQLFERGHMIRAAIPTVAQLKSMEAKLHRTKGELEKTELTDELERTINIEHDTEKWYLQVQLAGCI